LILLAYLSIKDIKMKTPIPHISKKMYYRNWDIELVNDEESPSVIAKYNDFVDTGTLTKNKNGPVVWNSPDKIPSRVTFFALHMLKQAKK